MKHCNKCNQDKELSEFYKNKKSKDLHTAYCKKCSIAITKKWQQYNSHKMRTANKKWRAANPDKQLAIDIKRYNLTVDQYRQMVMNQNGKCAICCKSQLRLHIDHCHKTGKVRGLLCNTCNRVLGIFEDSLDRFQSAVNYLR